MNPFQPPADDSLGFAQSKRRGSGYFVDGQLLVAEKGTALPDLCLYSGQPTQGQRTTKKLVWASPAIAILLVISPLIYIIVYLIVRKSGTLEYSLGDEARSRRTSGIVITLGGIAASIVMMAVSADQNSVPMLIVALLLMITALIIGLIRSRVIQIVKIDKSHIHLKLRPETAQAFAAALAR